MKWEDKIKEDSIYSDTFKELLIDFLKDKKPNTLKGYVSVVYQICHSAGKDFLQLGYADFLAFLSSVSNPGTHNVYLGYMRVLSKHIDSRLNTRIFNDVSKIPKNPKDAIISFNKLPKYEDIDKVFEYLKNKEDKTTFTAISLALILSLTTQEICDLKRKQFFIDKNGEAGIRIYTNKQIDRFLYIPDNLKELILNLRGDSNSTSAEDYLLLNKQQRPLSPRVIQKNLHDACCDCNVKAFTLSSIRILSISNIISQGADLNELARRNGTGTTWFFRYDRVVNELKSDPVKLNHIEVKW